MLTVTTPSVANREVDEVLGMVSGEAILGANIFKEIALMVSASGTAVRLK